ncbi:general substrate transporter [Mycena filopes]|nr:general substrate transporter [Mycena filopes]
MVGVTQSGPLSTTRRRALAGKSGWGVFSGVLNMHSFEDRMGDAVTDSGKKGWLVAILELGACYFADKLSRKYTIVLAVVVFCIGVIVQTVATGPPFIFGGRFVTGLGVGSLSMAVPLYNSEISPPEVRGSLVALQQLAITFGIMISFWIDYGTNYIGGNGAGQKEAAWRIPLGLQLVPALILGVGILFMPFSPRWLVNQRRDDEALAVLSRARGLPEEADLVQIEFLEIKAQYLFEKETSEIRFPDYQDGGFWSDFKLGFFAYLSLLRERSLLYRVAVGSLTMFFQQWTGINAILYYAPSIFQELGLTGNAISLLATGVVGIAMFLATIPAVLYVDQLGRTARCHFMVAILTGLFHNSWPQHCCCGMGGLYSWGPCAWIIIAEALITPNSDMAFMNNFIVGQVTPTMLQHLGFGTFVFFGVPETKGVTLEEMEEVFGSTTGIAMEDQTRLDNIHRRLGLFTDSPQDAKDPEAKGSEERTSDSEKASDGGGVSEKKRQ